MAQRYAGSGGGGAQTAGAPRAYLQESKGFHRGLQFFWEVAWDHMALYAVLFNALFSIWHLISSLCMHAPIWDVYYTFLLT